MKKYLDFSQEFGKVDEELIAEAGKPWTIKRGDIFRLGTDRNLRSDVCPVCQIVRRT